MYYASDKMSISCVVMTIRGSAVSYVYPVSHAEVEPSHVFDGLRWRGVFGVGAQ